MTNGESRSFFQNEILGAAHVFSFGAIDAPCPGAGYGVGQAIAITVPGAEWGLGAYMLGERAVGAAGGLGRVFESSEARANLIGIVRGQISDKVHVSAGRAGVEFEGLTHEGLSHIIKQILGPG